MLMSKRAKGQMYHVLHLSIYLSIYLSSFYLTIHLYLDSSEFLDSQSSSSLCPQLSGLFLPARINSEKAQDFPRKISKTKIKINSGGHYSFYENKCFDDMTSLCIRVTLFSDWGREKVIYRVAMHLQPLGPFKNQKY